MGGRAKATSQLPQTTANPPSKTAQTQAGPSAQKPARPLTTKEGQFLRAYFQNGGNATAACRLAYPNVKDSKSWGCKVATKLRPYISAWIEEEGLSESAIKARFVEGMEASDIKVFLGPGGQLVYSDPLPAWQARHSFARTAAQAKGMLIEKHEIKDTTPRRPLSPESAKKIDELILADLTDKPPEGG